MLVFEFEDPDSCDIRVVEADDMASAIELWREALRAEWRTAKDYDGSEPLNEPFLPRQIKLLSDAPVIRR